MDDKAPERRTGALRSERAGPTPFACTDVGPGVIAMTLTAVVQGLAGGTEIAIVFGLVGKTFGTEERTPLSVDTIAGSHIGSNAAIR